VPFLLPVKIAVVGCGAVGSFYGAKLARAGQEVHFLLRSDFDAVRRKGVFVRSPQGDFRVQPKCAREPNEIGQSDLVLIGLKTTANETFTRLLPPLVGEGTALVTLQNGLGNEEQLARLFPAEQILGGLCFVCLNRLEPGVIHHIDHGQVIIGEFQRWPEPRTHDLATLFRNAGIPCSVTDNLARAHWEKLTWNIPFNGLGVAGAAGLEPLTSSNDSLPIPAQLGPCLTTDKLLAEPAWAGIVRELIFEVIHTARALGFKVAESLAEQQIERTKTMGAYKASTLIDFERRQPLELESLFFEPLRQARNTGVPVPRLEALCRVLQSLDPASAQKPVQEATIASVKKLDR
jgi:2-dehydropantoate 2-reductase